MEEDTMSIRHTAIDSPLGPLTLSASGEHLTGLYFGRHDRRPTVAALGEYVAPDSDALLRRAASQVGDYLTGQRKDFDLPLLLAGKPRQRRIWELLSNIDYGQTTTYGELAVQLADGTIACEVGQTCGRNPLSIIVPCHRVIGKNGALTGYAGGLDRKRFLLELEEPACCPAGRLF
jgi:methylated-DNA-[protein]-cysteine S-methyltransferase